MGLQDSGEQESWSEQEALRSAGKCGAEAVDGGKELTMAVGVRLEPAREIVGRSWGRKGGERGLATKACFNWLVLIYVVVGKAINLPFIVLITSFSWLSVRPAGIKPSSHSTH